MPTRSELFVGTMIALGILATLLAFRVVPYPSFLP